MNPDYVDDEDFVALGPGRPDWEDDDFDPEPAVKRKVQRERPAKWRLALGLAIFWALAGVALFFNNPHHPVSSEGTTAGAVGHIVPSLHADPALTNSTGSLPPGTEVSPTTGNDQAIISMTQAAVEAWGRFASSGNLAFVRPFFLTDGPQYRRFEQEATALAQASAAAPYTYHLDNPAVLDQDGNERRLHGTVVVDHPGEATRSFDWTFVVHQSDLTDGVQNWRIWAVTDKAVS